MYKIRKALWFVIVVLTAISIGLVVRRVLILMEVIAAIPTDARFGVETRLKDYPLLTLVHILPGLLFVLLGPFLLRRLGLPLLMRKYPLQNWLFIGSAGMIGISAILMPFITMPIGGISEAAAAVLYGSIFLLETIQLLKAVLRNNAAAYSDWLLRTLALGLAIATTRPVMVLAFVTGNVSPQQFLGTAFWLSFTIHLCVAETWIYYRGVALQKHPNDTYDG